MQNKNKILEMYEESDEIQKLVFLDLLNDLIQYQKTLKRISKGQINLGRVKPTDSLFIPIKRQISREIISYAKENNITSTRPLVVSLQNFSNNILKKIFIEEQLKLDLFSVVKLKSHTLFLKNEFGKKIKSYYGTISEVALEEEVYPIRSMFIENLIDFGILEEAILTEKGDEIVEKIFEEAEKNLGLYFDYDTLRFKISKEKIKDTDFLENIEHSKKFFQKDKMFLEGEKFFNNDYGLVLLFGKLEDLEEIFTTLTGEKVIEVKNIAEFERKTGSFTYKGKTIKFDKTKDLYALLKIIFRYNLGEGIPTYEIIEGLNNKYPKEKINDIKNQLNRRIRKEYKENFLYGKSSEIFRKF